MSDQLEGVDFALAVYREEGVWTVQELAHTLLEDVETLAGALRRFPGDGGASALISIGEDYFVICRVAGPSVRLLLSDVTAADESDYPEFAEAVLDFLNLPEPEDEDDVQPAGELGIFADAGFSAIDMGILLDDDPFPDEALSEVARKIGFGKLFDDAVGLTSA
jgi:putative tRNA adenosine deaminase-associated protein